MFDHIKAWWLCHRECGIVHENGVAAVIYCCTRRTCRGRAKVAS